MFNKFKIIILFLLFAPCWLAAQEDATFYILKGDDMFKQTEYVDALDYYYEALEYELNEEEYSNLNTKIEKTRHCKVLMEKILEANEHGRNEEEEIYLQQLYSIHPSKLLKMKIDKFDEQRREQERLQKEQELKEQAEREAEEQRMREELERQRLEAEKKRAEEQIREEIRQWYSACSTNTITSYNAFIEKYPQSQNNSEALRRITELKDQERWELARRINNVDGYKNYIIGGGKYTEKAYSYIDKLYWDEARKIDDISAYQTYLSRTTDYIKSYSVTAQNRINILTQQDSIITEAALIKNSEDAYYKVQMARRLGLLNNHLEQRSLEIEEPHAYKQVKGSKIPYTQKQSYLSKYAQVAPYKHIKKIQTHVNKSHNSISDDTSWSYSLETQNKMNNTKKKSNITVTTSSYSSKLNRNNAFESYFDKNGMVQYSWFSVDGYVGTSVGTCLSIFEWRFGPIEIAPIVLGYNHILDYTQNIEHTGLGKVISRSIDECYLQPTVRFYLPLKGSADRAICIAGAPIIGIEPWFMAEIGYNYNMGLLNGHVFLRYNGDFVVGLQLKLCHVFKNKKLIFKART